MENPKPLCCLFCQLPFSNFELLGRHMHGMHSVLHGPEPSTSIASALHRIADLLQQLVDKSEAKAASDSDRDGHGCNFCRLMFGSRRELDAHYNTVQHAKAVALFYGER